MRNKMKLLKTDLADHKEEIKRQVVSLKEPRQAVANGTHPKEIKLETKN